MKSFYVLTAPEPKNIHADTVFIRDGFSWIAFLLPLPWLVFRRLWMIALCAVLAYLVTILLAETYRLDALPAAFSVVLSLWAGLEGGHARAMALVRRGWRIERVIAADRLGDAEEIYFTGREDSPATAPPAVPARRDPVPMNAVALGLIGPTGSR